MEDKQFYDLLYTFICDNKCSLNKWHEFRYIEKEKDIDIHCEVMYPSKGNMRVRRITKAMYKNEDNETVYRYTLYKFTKNRELNYEGVQHDTITNVVRFA